MEPQKPGQPTLSHYPQGSGSKKASETLDSVTGQMGGQGVSVSPVGEKSLKRFLERTAPTQEITQRKVTRTEGTRTEGIRTEGIRTEGIRTEGIRTEGTRTEGIRTEGIAQTKGEIPARPTGESSGICVGEQALPTVRDSSVWSVQEVKRDTAGMTAKLDLMPASQTTSQYSYKLLPGRKPGVHKLPGKYENYFKKQAEILSGNSNFGDVTGEYLWDLVSCGSPVRVLRERLGKQKYYSLPQDQKASLLNSLKFARASYHKAIKEKKALLSKLPPVPTLPASESATECGSGTKIADDSERSLPSTDSQALASPSQPLQATPILRATLSNPYKNRCFINSVVHYLRVILPDNDRDRLLNAASEQDASEQDSTVTAFARLFETMKRCESGHDLIKDEVTNKLNELVIACLKNNYFQGCVHLQEKRQVRQTGHQENSRQQLRRLEHDDAADFYMATWNLLRSRLPSMNQVKLYQEMRATVCEMNFTKNNLAAVDSAPFLILTFTEGDSIQRAVDRFFTTIPPDQQSPLSWADGDEVVSSRFGGRLVSGDYPSSITCRLRAEAPLQRLNFRFELQGLQNESQGKIDSVCREVQEGILTPVKVPVEDAAGVRRNITATPCCIVAHHGSDHDSGHYVTLEKTRGGWLLHDDDKPARLVAGLKEFLTGPPQFTPYLVACDVTGPA